MLTFSIIKIGTTLFSFSPIFECISPCFEIAKMPLPPKETFYKINIGTQKQNLYTKISYKPNVTQSKLIIFFQSPYTQTIDTSHNSIKRLSPN